MRVGTRHTGWILPALTGAAWGLSVLLWLADAGKPDPSVLDRAAVLGALTATVALAGRAALRLWRSDFASRILLGLVALSLLLAFAGLDHEVGGRAFGDEGIYRAHAERINEQGQVLRPWFIYPHLLFYLDALALWIADLFAPATRAVARVLYGVEGELPLAVLVTRSITALLSALTVIPVFAAARRLAGPVAAVAAGVMATLSPLALHVGHLNISDVPGRFFAAMTLMSVAALLERTDDEPLGAYLAAGLWAGLAAGSKYPAGLVAVAIVGVWLRHRVSGAWSSRRSLGIVWAGAVAVAAFLAATPSFLAFPGAVFGGGADALFGVRQYADGGWTGVVRASNAVYYLEQIAATLGWPALVLGAAGLGGLPRPERVRVAWFLPLPVAFLGLLLALEMAVPRNLLPVLPALSVILGAGLAGWRSWLDRIPWRRTAAALLALGVFALPAVRTTGTTVRLIRPTTREEAGRWAERNLPPGSFVIQEAYTPRLGPEWRFPGRYPRFAIRIDPDELRHPRHDFLFLAAGSYRRFLDPNNLDDPILEHGARRYTEIFGSFDLVRSWQPERLQSGTELRLYRLDPNDPPFTRSALLEAADALLRSPAMAPEGDAGDAITYTETGQWALFKVYLEAGSYRVRLETTADSGSLEVRDRTNRALAETAYLGEPEVTVDLPDRDKVFLYVTLPPGSRLAGVRIAPPAS